MIDGCQFAWRSLHFQTVLCPAAMADKDGSWQAPRSRNHDVIRDPRTGDRQRLAAAESRCNRMLADHRAGRVRDIKARDARLRNAIEDGWERIEANRGLNVSFETGSVLARLGLLAQAQEDPAGAARRLETHLQTQCEPDGALALAELSYHVGLASQTGSPATALAWYRDAAALAALALADPAGTRPDLALDDP